MPKETKTKAKRVSPAAADADFAPAKVKQVNNPCKLRSSITPGTVLILLSGRFRGKRVVFLKQLSSGLLLVSGPYRVNGVPIKRVNQAYVIATSTKIDISGVQVPAIDDGYFAREEEEAPEGEDAFFANKAAAAAVVSDQRKADQITLDDQLEPVIEGVDMLKAYLQAKFTLNNGDKPHEMVF